MSLIDGHANEFLPADDRGLAYGDGLFETILVHAGQPVWWTEHLQRLRTGAVRLGIAAPADEEWLADARQLMAANHAPKSFVLKLILTRGGGGRGYSPVTALAPRRIVQCAPAPAIDPRWQREGIRVRRCDLRLGVQPLLAGIKHLNRLEQVLARGEWSDPEIAEGVLLDANANLVCATAANIFLVKQDELLTPSVERCGVAGICRSQLLSGLGARVASLTMSDLFAAEELFVCSSVRGILPVTALGDHNWPIGPITRRCMVWLARHTPAFADHAD
ncbi:MAG: aminodeoxychorismate lyase [Pseudomarimonas sp.]